MKVSKQADYALRVLFTLAERYGRAPVSIRDLAEQNHVPKTVLEHIMLDLKSEGWVESTPGKYGGYRLSRPPEAIAMGQVVRHFDGLLAPINCVSVAQYEPCTQEATCRFRRVFLEVRNEVALRMDGASLASVMTGQPVQKHEVFDESLTAGAGI